LLLLFNIGPTRSNVEAWNLNESGFVDLKDIKAIIDLMKKNSISEFELERQDFKIKLKRSGNGSASAPQYEDSPVITYAPSSMPIPSAGGAAPQIAGSTSGEVEIKSPMIGTIYRAPSPEAGSYVEVGTEVTPDTVVCIIEAMKVMNEIKAEAKGIITQVLVENAKPVEFGQPLFKIRPT
jgi:acetyl-CoA carboxylase biotin carboxyl carrier protein